MRRIAAALLLVLVTLPAFTTSASAHPLGNFTVNHLAIVTVARDAVRVRYVLDLAEIPTLQETNAGAVEGIAGRLAAGLSLRLGGVTVPLAIDHATTERLGGQAGLETLRVVVDLAALVAVREGSAVAFNDVNYLGRLGWHDVVLRGAVGDASVGPSEPTNELRQYPSDATVVPPDRSAAAATVRLSVDVGGVAVQSGEPSRFAVDLSADRLTAFLRAGGTSDLAALLAAILVAMLLGALHALGPGHGKAMVGAYLVGAKGTPAQAVILGTTVTVTHTIGIYALGALTLVAAQYVLPERLYPMLGVISGLLVVAIGLGMLRTRLRGARQAPHAHDHDHPHGDGRGQHRHDARLGSRGLLALGISGGLLPCPTALIVLLAAVSFHNILLGMLLVAAFSVGLAAVLTGIGLAVVLGTRYLSGNERAMRIAGSRAARYLPPLSAAAITIAGIVIALQAAQGLA